MGFADGILGIKLDDDSATNDKPKYLTRTLIFKQPVNKAIVPHFPCFKLPQGDKVEL